MTKEIQKTLLLITVYIIGFIPTLYSQTLYKISGSKNNDMKLSGTSTLHNWTMDAKSFTGNAQFDFKPGDDNKITSIKSLDFSLVVLNLKSGEKGLDKNAYKALKTSQYKNIDYKLTSATVLPEKADTFLIKTHGNLTIAGATKDVAIDVSCIVNDDATITCKGSDKLKMSDYKIKPPSFMFGAMKAGDGLALDFTLVYKD